MHRTVYVIITVLEIILYDDELLFGDSLPPEIRNAAA